MAGLSVRLTAGSKSESTECVASVFTPFLRPVLGPFKPIKHEPNAHDEHDEHEEVSPMFFLCLPNKTC